MNIDEQKLIELIKKNPTLYTDTNKHKYLQRNEIWEEIAKELKQDDVEACKIKWNTLRTQFRRIYKQEKIAKTKGQNKWKHYKRMDFLIPYLINIISPEMVNVINPLEVKFEADTDYQDDLIDSIATSSTVIENESFNHESDNSNEEFFSTVALTMSTFPLEHQVRIKAIIMQQINEMQAVMENASSLEFPANPFKQTSTDIS